MARTTGSDELYRLIHSLTTEEKGYFKKFARRHTSKGNNYLQLFDAINKQKEFEEAGLKKKFKNYAVMKVYLFEILLNSLMLADTDMGLQGELLKSWFHIRYLNKKGLGDKAIQLTRAAIKKANSAELFWLENELLRMLHDFEKVTWKTNERDEKNRKFFDDLSIVKNKQEESDIYFKFLRTLIEANYVKTFSNDLKESFYQDLPLHLLEENRTILSIKAKRGYFNARITFYGLTRNLEKQYSAAEEWYFFEKKLTEENHTLSSWSNQLFSIRQFICANLYSKKAENVFALNEEMRKLTAKQVIQNIENELCYFSFQQQAYWHSCQHKEGEEFTRTEYPHQLIMQYGNSFRPYLREIHRYKLLFELSNCNHKNACTTIAEFELLGIKKDATFYYKSCELTKILLQVALQEYQLLPALVSNALNHLDLTHAEVKMLKAIRKITAVDSQKRLKELLKILPMGNDKIILFNTLGVNSWITAWLTEKPISEIIKASGEL